MTVIPFEATNVSLAGFLQENEISTLYICGLTTDYCVKTTALDAVNLGFHTCDHRCHKTCK